MLYSGHNLLACMRMRVRGPTSDPLPSSDSEVHQRRGGIRREFTSVSLSLSVVRPFYLSSYLPRPCTHSSNETMSTSSQLPKGEGQVG